MTDSDKKPFIQKAQQDKLRYERSKFKGMFIKIKELKYKKAKNSYIIYHQKRFQELLGTENTRLINR